jgi:hypothetical protein
MGSWTYLKKPVDYTTPLCDEWLTMPYSPHYLLLVQLVLQLIQCLYIPHHTFLFPLFLTSHICILFLQMRNSAFILHSHSIHLNDTFMWKNTEKTKLVIIQLNITKFSVSEILLFKIKFHYWSNFLRRIAHNRGTGMYPEMCKCMGRENFAAWYTVFRSPHFIGSCMCDTTTNLSCLYLSQRFRDWILSPSSDKTYLLDQSIEVALISGPLEIGTSFIDWAQLSRCLPQDEDRIQSPTLWFK